MKQKGKSVKRVYFLGEMKGVYRMQNIIKYCMDRPSEYKIFYNGFAKNFSILKYISSLLLGIIRVIRADIIYINTLNADIDFLWELFWGKVFNKFIIIDYYVSVYDTVVLDRAWFKENSFMAKLARCIDKYYFRIGEKLIFLNETEKERYCCIAGINVKEERYAIIPLYAESAGIIESKYIKEERTELSICWWGSYLPLHGLNNLLEAARILKDRGVKIRWSFLGNSNKKGKTYRDKAEQLEIDDICFFSDDLSFKNGKLLPFLQENCDLALGSFGDSEKAKNVLANKIVDASAMKVNLFTGYSKAIEEFFDENNSLFMSGNRPEEIADKIESICNASRDELRRRIEVSYEIYEKNFALESFERRIGDVLRRNG